MKKLLSLNAGAILASTSPAWLADLLRQKGFDLSSLTEVTKTYQQLTSAVLLDKADRDPNYLDGTDMSFWHREIHPVLANVLPTLKIPSEGKIMELGVYKGDSFRLLSQVFGAERVRGIDICKYVDDPRILNVDVRALNPEHDIPLAVAWNDISNWAGSPRSRMAAFKYALRNLVVSGIYIDEALEDIPKDLPLGDFELVLSRENISVFRRVRATKV